MGSELDESFATFRLCTNLSGMKKWPTVTHCTLIGAHAISWTRVKTKKVKCDVLPSEIGEFWGNME
jgi:hypothetical protein